MHKRLERIVNTAPVQIILAELREAIAEAEQAGVAPSMLQRARSKEKYAEKVQMGAKRKRAEQELTLIATSTSPAFCDVDKLRARLGEAERLGISPAVRKRSQTLLQEAVDAQAVQMMDAALIAQRRAAATSELERLLKLAPNALKLEELRAAIAEATLIGVVSSGAMQQAQAKLAYAEKSQLAARRKAIEGEVNAAAAGEPIQLNARALEDIINEASELGLAAAVLAPARQALEAAHAAQAAERAAKRKAAEEALEAMLQARSW
jgi:hypothetical protein